MKASQISHSEMVGVQACLFAGFVFPACMTVCLCVCMCITCMPGACTGQKHAESFGSGVVEGCKLPSGCLELKPRSESTQDR